jgi:hypothetical protein
VHPDTHFLQLAKVDGVDLENPPSDKIFHPVDSQDDTDDISLLARRCNQSNQSNKSAATNIMVTPDYQGLTHLLQTINNPQPTPQLPPP